uniref:Uncharacterized protein n=1 Tax=Onchocerca volvulus TaxID=6282 RepID=A0A8R1U0Y0_ONCVO
MSCRAQIIRGFFSVEKIVSHIKYERTIQEKKLLHDNLLRLNWEKKIIWRHGGCRLFFRHLKPRLRHICEHLNEFK